MHSVDVVVVSFNSRRHLRAAVGDLSKEAGVNVIVVDNASSDGSLDVVSDLSVLTVALEENRGFAAGCNHGWRAGAAPYVLFINPDARIERASLTALVDAVERDRGVAIVAPQILGADGSLEFSQRRFPALRSTFAQALFLHRVFPHAEWTDEVVRDPSRYEAPASPAWVSGACLLVRRSVLEAIGGWDESFFLYAEDKDLCRRVRDAGLEVRYEPEAIAMHIGGQSSPRPSLLPQLAASRIRYLEKHETHRIALVHRIGIALSALSHLLVARTQGMRVGYARAFKTALRL